jgi:hypothetical protein
VSDAGWVCSALEALALRLSESEVLRSPDDQGRPIRKLVEITCDLPEVGLKCAQRVGDVLEGGYYRTAILPHRVVKGGSRGPFPMEQRAAFENWLRQACGRRLVKTGRRYESQ